MNGEFRESLEVFHHGSRFYVPIVVHGLSKRRVGAKSFTEGLNFGFCISKDT
jgi:hypothetical protein